mgnify:CR=1 FL=1
MQSTIEKQYNQLLNKYQKQFRELGIEMSIKDNSFQLPGRKKPIKDTRVCLKAMDRQKDDKFLMNWVDLDDEVELKIEQLLHNLTICRKLEKTYAGLKFSIHSIENKMVLVHEDKNEEYIITVTNEDDTYVGTVTKEKPEYICGYEQAITDKLSLTIDSDYEDFSLTWTYKIQGCDVDKLPEQIEEAVQVLTNYKVE